MNTTCNLFGTNDSEVKKCNAVIAVKRASGSLSMIGCVFMLFLIVVYKKYTTFVQKTIINMTVACLVCAVAYVMGDDQVEGGFCKFQGFLTNYSDWAVLMWMMSIIIVMFIYTVKEKTIPANREWIFYLVCWGWPFLVSLLPFTQNRYGPAGAWCWIRHEKKYDGAGTYVWIEELLWRFGIWYIPLFLTLIVMIVLYGYMYYIARRKMQSFQGFANDHPTPSNLLEEIKPLRAYPVIYLLINICPVVNRIHNALHKDDPSFALVLLHVIFTPIVGFVNAIIFGCNRDTLNNLRWMNFKNAVLDRISIRRTILDTYDPHGGLAEEEVDDVDLQINPRDDD